MSCAAILIFVSFVGLLNGQKTQAQLLQPDCGLTGIADQIMDGKNAVHGANPWMAYLYLEENNFQCGGSLIHKRFVLTAAHCIVDGENLYVRLGEYYSEFRASTSIVYNVTLALRNRHFQYFKYLDDVDLRKSDPRAKFNVYDGSLAIMNRHLPYSVLQHDIGLLKLDPEVQFNAFIRPICIFTDGLQAPFVTSYTVTGWGRTRRQAVAEKLQTLKLKEKHPQECYDHMGVRLIPGQICAGNPTGDTCVGDSGSPLGHQVNINGIMRYTQFGFVSYGLDRCISPAVYTRVTYYSTWISEAVKIWE